MNEPQIQCNTLILGSGITVKLPKCDFNIEYLKTPGVLHAVPNSFRLKSQLTDVNAQVCTISLLHLLLELPTVANIPLFFQDIQPHSLRKPASQPHCTAHLSIIQFLPLLSEEPHMLRLWEMRRMTLCS